MVLLQPHPIVYRYHFLGNPWRASLTASTVFIEKSGETVKTISQELGKSSWCRRKFSRMIRFILFRFTAPRIRRFTLIPKRLYARLFAKKISENPFPLSRSPFLYTWENSCDFLRSLSLGSPNPFTRLRRQPLSPFCSSTSDNGLSGPGFHACPKPVAAFTLGITGLKCPFTHRSYPSYC